MENAHQVARKVLTENRPWLNHLDRKLLIREILEGAELEAALEEELAADCSHNRNRKKLQILSAITVGKLQELDQLIAGLRPAPALEVRHG